MGEGIRVAPAPYASGPAVAPPKTGRQDPFLARGRGKRDRPLLPSLLHPSPVAVRVRELDGRHDLSELPTASSTSSTSSSSFLESTYSNKLFPPQHLVPVCVLMRFSSLFFPFQCPGLLSHPPPPLPTRPSTTQPSDSLTCMRRCRCRRRKFAADMMIVNGST